MLLLDAKTPAKRRFCGLGEVYQTGRPPRALARLAATALRTASRRPGSSIPAASEAAAEASSGLGAGAGAGASSGAGGAGTGPGANRTDGGVASPRPAASFARISPSIRPSSNAQVDETVVTWSVPSRARRCGQAERAIAAPTASGQARVT